MIGSVGMWLKKIMHDKSSNKLGFNLWDRAFRKIKDS